MTSKREPSAIGLRIEKLRNMAALPARELDRLAETTEGHASLVESGVVKSVSAETVAKFARVFGVSLDWLITGDGKEPTERNVRAAVECARKDGAPPKTGTS